jgi:hypothetical protein
MIVKLSLLRVYPWRRAVELAAIFWIAALASLPAYCDTPSYYDFSPSSVMSLGYGFSVRDLTRQKQLCVDFDKDPLDSGALGTTATIQCLHSTCFAVSGIWNQLPPTTSKPAARNFAMHECR